MAETTRPKRKRSIPRYKPDFHQELVESLDLDISEERRSEVVELVRSKTREMEGVPAMISAFASVLKEEYLVSADMDPMPLIMQVLRSTIQNRKCHNTGRLAPSEATWKVLVSLGLVKNFEVFAAEAKRKRKTCRHGEIDMEAVRPALDCLVNPSIINEPLLFVICTVFLGHCVNLLNTTVSEHFSYRCNFGESSIEGRMDLSIVYIKLPEPPLISVVIEVNNEDVSMDVSTLSKDSLAPLFYKGYMVYRKQHVMPLLVLTDCYIWHCFKMDMSEQLSIEEYWYARYSGSEDKSASLLPTISNLNPTPVLSEIIAFTKELVHKQQQANN